MATLTAELATVPLWRRTVVAVVGIAAGALAMFVIPGAQALAMSWSSDGAEIIHRVHGVGFGAIMTLCLGVPFVAQVHQPERKVSLVQAGVAATLAVLVALVAGGVPAEATPFVVFLAAGGVIVAVHPARREILTVSGRQPDRMLAAIAGLGAGPLLVYAWLQAAAQRAAAVSDPHAMPPHYAGMAALVLCILALAIVGAYGASGYRWTATLAGLATVALGAVSLLNPGFVSALRPAAAVAAIVGGGAFIAATFRRRPPAR
jgi:hypothetical protein